MKIEISKKKKKKKKKNGQPTTTTWRLKITSNIDVDSFREN
jgi:hypothetical protein